MLSNRYYLGEINFRGMRYEGRHPALIERELFDRVQTVLRLKATTGEKNFRHQHHLKGSLFCGECGTRMVFSRNRGNGGAYDYFKCMSKEYGRGCTVGYVRADWLEDQVEQAWLSTGLAEGLDGATAGALRQALLNELARRHATTNLELARAAKRLDGLAAERTALVRAHLAGAVPLDLLKQEQDRITVEMSHNQGIIEAASVTTREIEATLNRALELAANCYQTYLDASATGKRHLNQLFFERFEVFVRRDPLAGDTCERGDQAGVSGLPERSGGAHSRNGRGHGDRDTTGRGGSRRALNHGRTGMHGVEGCLAAPFDQLAALTDKGTEREAPAGQASGNLNPETS